MQDQEGGAIPHPKPDEDVAEPFQTKKPRTPPLTYEIGEAGADTASLSEFSKLATLLRRRGETTTLIGNTNVRDAVTFGDADYSIRTNAGASLGPAESCESDEGEQPPPTRSRDARFLAERTSAITGC